MGTAGRVASGSRGLFARRQVKAFKDDDDIDDDAKSTRKGAWKVAKKGADVGALSCPATCPDEYANYCGGVSDNPCVGDQCCYGPDAETIFGSAEGPCYQFSGCVKRDGSCSGAGACMYASVDMITNSCKGGDKSEACYFATADTIKDSCNDGNKACRMVCYYGGTVGHGTDSCNDGEQACFGLGVEGTVGSVTDSCNEEKACYLLAGWSGTVASINNGCNSVNGCYQLALYGGDVGPIKKSCNGMDKSCFYLAAQGGNVASIHKSCNSKTQAPCSNLASSKSGQISIGNVRNKRGTEKIRRHSKDQAGTIVECLAKCANNKDGCTSIQWKEKIQRSCGLFKGKLTDKCGKNNVCVKVYGQRRRKSSIPLQKSITRGSGRKMVVVCRARLRQG